MAQAPLREVPVGEKTAAYTATKKHDLSVKSVKNAEVLPPDYRAGRANLQEKVAQLRFP